MLVVSMDSGFPAFLPGLGGQVGCFGSLGAINLTCPSLGRFGASLALRPFARLCRAALGLSGPCSALHFLLPGPIFGFRLPAS